MSRRRVENILLVGTSTGATALIGTLSGLPVWAQVAGTSLAAAGCVLLCEAGWSLPEWSRLLGEAYRQEARPWEYVQPTIVSVELFPPRAHGGLETDYVRLVVQFANLAGRPASVEDVRGTASFDNSYPPDALPPISVGSVAPHSCLPNPLVVPVRIGPVPQGTLRSIWKNGAGSVDVTLALNCTVCGHRVSYAATERAYFVGAPSSGKRGGPREARPSGEPSSW